MYKYKLYIFTSLVYMLKHQPKKILKKNSPLNEFKKIIFYFLYAKRPFRGKINSAKQIIPWKGRFLYA